MGQANGPPTDEMLMAYADGEASPEEAAAVEAALSDPLVAERLALFEGTRRLAADAFPPEPVPDGLKAQIEAMVAAGARPANDPLPAAAAGDNVVAFRRTVPERSARRRATMAVAAAVLGLAIGIGAFFAGAELGGSQAPSRGQGIAVLAALPLGAALTAPSGATTEVDGTAVRPVSTFRAASGELCREFEVSGVATVSGVACHRDGDWAVDFAVAGGAAAEGSYAPASGNEALDAYLSGVDAGAPLDAAAEKAALAALR